MGIFKKNNKSWSLGNLKNLEDITLDDMKNNPIWVNDITGEWENDFDESSERPIIGTNDITSSMIDEFVSISMLVKFPSESEFGSANLEEDGSITCLAVWRDDEWIIGSKAFQGIDDIEIEIIPAINGENNIIYIYDLKLDVGRIK